MPITVFRRVSHQSVAALAPTITGFNANPPTVTSAGGTVVLTATVANAVSITLDGGAVTAAQLLAGISVAPSSGHTYTLIATGANGASPMTATATASVIVTTSGNIVYTATMVPWNGSFSVLAQGKHMCGVMMADGLMYVFPKDCASISQPGNLGGSVDGNQEIYTFDPNANQWTVAQPYYVRNNALLQGSNPDDAWIIAKGNEFYYFFSQTTASGNTYYSPPQDGTYATPINNNTTVSAYLPASLGGNATYGTWRIVFGSNFNYHGDRAWRGWLDVQNNVFVTPMNVGESTGFLITEATTGADLTDYDGSLPWSFGSAGVCSVSGCAVDLATRNVYLFSVDIASICVVNMDAIFHKTRGSGAFVQQIIQCAPFTGPFGTQYTGKIAWHDGIRAVCMPVVDHWFIYQPDTNTMSSFPRLDGRISDWSVDGGGNPISTPGAGPWVQLQDTVYHAPSQDVFTYGSIDFAAPGNQSMVPGLYRNHFTIAPSIPSWVASLNTVGSATLPSGNGQTVGQVYSLNIGTGPWDTGGGIAPLFTAWNSGCYAPACGTLGSLVFVGAGDHDSFNNCVFVHDVALRAIRNINLPSAFCANSGTFDFANATYQDGTPGVGHTYGCVQHLPPSMGGGTQGSVILIIRTYWYLQETSGANVSFRCDLATGVWSQASSNGASSNQEQTWCFDSLRSQFVGMDSGSGSVTQNVLRRLGSFNSSGVGVHSDFAMSVQDMMAHEPTMCYAPVQDAYFAYGWNGISYGIRAWNATTLAKSDLSFSGDALPAGTGLGFQWVPDAGVFYLRNCTPGQEQFLWTLTPPSGAWQTGLWNVTKITMPGVTVAASNPSTGTNGMWGQFQYVPPVKSLMWCHDAGQGVYDYRAA